MNEQHGEGNKSAVERLAAMTTIGEILETAMSFEKTARDFYATLVPNVSKPLRGLVEELAEEEERHYNLFRELRDRPDVESHIANEIETPSTDHKFADYVMKPDLGETPDDQSILQYAMGREHAAAEHYAALARTTPKGAIRDLFQFLADEELSHKAELEKVYYETIHSGGV